MGRMTECKHIWKPWKVERVITADRTNKVFVFKCPICGAEKPAVDDPIRKHARPSS